MKSTTCYLQLVLVGLVIGCSEPESKIKVNNKPPILDLRITETSNRFTLDGSLSKDPEGDSLTYRWITTSGLLSINSPLSRKTFFDIPSTDKSFTTEVSLELNDGFNTVRTKQSLLVPALNQMIAYGLGKNLVRGVSNNTDYYWYFDQANTGAYSDVNCGPSCASMAIKWTNSSTNSSPQAARNAYRQTGGWWFTSDVNKYLNDNGVNNSFISLESIDILKNKIDEGKIVVLCVDMYYIEYQADNTFRHGKFYIANSLGWGHFVVVKGYKEVDNNTFYEVYDPYSFGKRYADNSLKGIDRYYKASDLDMATNNWWDYAIVVSKTAKGGRVAAEIGAIDPSTIEHKSGR